MSSKGWKIRGRIDSIESSDIPGVQISCGTIGTLNGSGLTLEISNGKMTVKLPGTDVTIECGKKEYEEESKEMLKNFDYKSFMMSINKDDS